MFKFKFPVLSLLSVCLLFTYCNGQTKTNHSNKISAQQSFTSRNTKLIKTQGTTEHQNVHCSLQDKNGNLWFGTTGEGVYRYDGKEFIQFTKKDGLGNNTIFSILEDKSGNIWFGTADGVSKYDGKTISKVPFNVISLSRFGTSIPQLEKNMVSSIFQDKSGIIWFGTTADLYCYDGKSFSRFLDRAAVLNRQHLTLKWIQCFLQDDNGTIWMGSGPIAMEGVIRFDGKSVTGIRPNGDGWIRTIVAAQNKKLWFGGRGNGNFIYDGKSFAKYAEKVGIGHPLLADRSGNIWFSGEEKISTVESVGGIWRYDGRTFKNYHTKDGLSKYFVYSMLADRDGNIWIGTRNCGLFRYNGQEIISFSK
jgi:hypothetical protein